MKQSLAYARAVMDMEVEPDDKNFVKVMTLKKEVMASVLSAGVRLNDSSLRKKDEDKVGELLKQVKAKSQGRTEPVAAEEVTKAELFG